MSRSDSRGNWTPERIQKLIDMWHAGVPIRAMGRELAVTHNSIVGKVHRLGLPNRVSPFDKPPVIEPEEIPDTTRYPVPEPDPRRCIWPIGVQGTKEFHWCGKKPAFGKQLCFDHEAKAYTMRRVGEPVPLPIVATPRKSG